MHPYASNMHLYASVCIRMHPYSSIRLIYASERQYSTHVFGERVKKSKDCRNRLSYNAFRSAKSIRIQPIITNFINIVYSKNPKVEICLKCGFRVFVCYLVVVRL